MLYKKNVSLNIALLLTLVLALQGCTPTARKEVGVLISEVKTGASGNNNDEFIELYNSSSEPVDMSGWSITYTLNENETGLPVYLWQTTQLIPAHGHLLLVRSDDPGRATADAVFEQPLNTFFGALSLVDPSGIVADKVGWGKIVQSAAEGEPAPSPEDGYSLERKPGGEEGSTLDTDNNLDDFVLQEQPDPQSSGSPSTPSSEPQVELLLEGPQSAEPGSTIFYRISAVNLSKKDLQDLQILFPVNPDLNYDSLPEKAIRDGNVIRWPIAILPTGSSADFQLQAALPWTYGVVSSTNTRLENAGGDILDFAGSLHTTVEGGTLPIHLARTMLEEEVTIEGIATMYTGGFYAGSGAKFYMQDETAGVQVYVSGAGSTLNVPIGARVRVRGTATLYNNSVEIVPASAADVEILTTEGDKTEPLPVAISNLINDPDTYAGRLVQIEGTLATLEEFNYSYEINMTDKEGNILSLYVDKLTEINAELLDRGCIYSVAGIPEWRSTTLYLNPRLDSDFAEVFQAGVSIAASAPSSILPEEEALVTLTVTNHLPDPIENITISISNPALGGEIISIEDQGVQDENGLQWTIASLEGGGESAAVGYRIRPSDSSTILIRNYQAAYEGVENSVRGPGFTMYVGAAVPIWAIQGNSDTSPYKQQYLTTQGVVTGVFPELGGFFIQDPSGDGSAETSDGLFVNMEDPGTISTGDLVSLTGLVSEASSLTQLIVTSRNDIVLEQQGMELPEASVYNPPVTEAESLLYSEALEGMLVSTAGPLRAVAPTSQYGEYALVPDNYPEERVFRTDPAGMLIIVDDGSDITHTDGSTLLYAVATGDIVSDLVGPLAYTYGQYKIEPVQTPVVQPAEHVLPVLELPEDGFSIMTWNVENLFDILSPHPGSPPMPTVSEYQIALAKIAITIHHAGYPTLIALQEVENIGILEDLAEEEMLAEYNYQPYLIEGKDSRGIDVGYMVRGNHVSSVQVEQRDAPGEVFSRPPLLLQAKIQTQAEETLTVSLLNNHFLSLSEGEEITEPRRTAQASWNAGITEELLDIDEHAAVAVLGDLNSFYDTAPLEVLEAVGLTHLYDLEGMEENYTYVYQGLSESLDHILISSGLEDLFVGFNVLHVNADYPPPLPDDTTPERKSDHDPVIAWFAYP